MDRITLFRAAGWRELVGGDWCPARNGKPWVRCPQCKQRARLEDHEIGLDGTITPSLVCACGWHVWAKLDEYEPPEAA